MYKVLIVEDQLEIRELLEVTFELGPYRVLSAEDGNEGIRLAVNEKPNIILLDLVLSGDVTGLEVCRYLKQELATRDTPIFILTSKGQAWDREAAFEAGADQFIVKPFSPAELRAIVDLRLRLA
jgi:DNA-binding response OmpR family regulator